MTNPRTTNSGTAAASVHRSGPEGNGRGGVIHSENPATGEIVGTVSIGTVDDVAEAVAGSRAVFASWASRTVSERATVLRDAARRIRERVDELSALHTAEIGRPGHESRGSVLAAADAFEEFAVLGTIRGGRRLDGDAAAIDLVESAPRGVAAVITPWNDPLPIAATHLAANLIVGNTVVLKPSELAPVTTAALADLVDAPDGVSTLVHGDGLTGAALAASDVDIVAHTGSVRTGREIATRCGNRLSKAIVELGGCDPIIVDAGVDPSWAAEQIALGAFTHAGQICTAVERVILHRDVADAVLDELVRHVAELRVGPGDDPSTDIGPLITADARRRVREMVTDAVRRGARVVTGTTGDPDDDEPGWFHPPTVLVDVPIGAPLWSDEIFGPVAPVRTVDTFDDAVALAADSPFGLAATVLTHSADHAMAANRALRVGTLKINHVFGGAPAGSAEPAGCSGLGRGYGPELLDEVTRSRVLHHRIVQER